VFIVVALDARLATALPVPGPPEGNADDPQTQQIRAMADAAVAQLRRSGLGAQFLLRWGDPKKVLIKEADTCDADCIFVGALGQTGLARLLMGSVSTAVAISAHCSVEVVR
jgi:nucleotide-binding universal stress UspA family protein